MILAAGIPNPISIVTDAAGSAARAAAEPIVRSIASSFVGWLAQACRDVGSELVSVLARSASPQFDRGWWASPQNRELMGTVTALAALLALAFLFLALLQGLLAGDPVGMLRTALGHVPLSVLGIGVVIAVTELLLRVTDEATGLVVRGIPENLGRFIQGFGLDASVWTGGLAAVVLLAVFLIGALLVWAELVVRSALVYLLVAFAPLVLAARIWPAARGMFRKLCELGIALIVSKLAIGLALAVGATALGAGRAVDASTAGTAGGGMSLAGLLGGATLMGLAAFTPFVVLRLLPLVETAAVAHGVSRSPVRGAQVAAAASTYPARLARMAGGSAGAVTSVSGGAGGAAGALGTSALRSLPRSGPGGAVPQAGPRTAPSPSGNGRAASSGTGGAASSGTGGAASSGTGGAASSGTGGAASAAAGKHTGTDTGAGPGRRQPSPSGNETLPPTKRPRPPAAS